MSNLTAANPNQITFLADTNTHRFRFEIPSSAGDKVYIVSQALRNGEWACGCPAWCFKKPGKERSCKHLKALMPLLLQVGQERKQIA